MCFQCQRLGHIGVQPRTIHRALWQRSLSVGTECVLSGMPAQSFCSATAPDHRNSWCAPSFTPEGAHSCGDGLPPPVCPHAAFGLEGGWGLGQTNLTHHFPKPNCWGCVCDGHRPRVQACQELPRVNTCTGHSCGNQESHRAWHLSPACLVTLGRSKPHCKMSCSFCSSAWCPGTALPCVTLGRELTAGMRAPI